MFRIRRVFNDLNPVDRDALAQVQSLLGDQFPGLRTGEVDKLPDRLSRQIHYGFQSVLFVAEGPKRKISGFALLLYDPILHFGYLDYIAAGMSSTGRGLGGLLYERVRLEARELDCIGLFFECLPDDPTLCRDPETLKQNQARLRFYERYGARPITGTAYETPLQPDDDNPPYLVFDGLGRGKGLRRERGRLIVKAILEKKYARLCSPEYNRMVLNSFNDDPVRLRPPLYIPVEKEAVPPETVPDDEKIVLVINSGHEIHHVRERGYVEAPVRIEAIRKELDRTGLFSVMDVRHFGNGFVNEIHDKDFVRYLEKVCLRIEGSKSIYPYVFPIRNQAKPPKDLSVRAGYYCIDTFTPLNRNAFLAARKGVDCTMTAARGILDGARLAYSLVRPPGHHAERRSFGGFCYLNNLAIAANYLSKKGKVAILDIDYHHGNGQQDIFYRRADVLTVSIHGHPGFAYPYFSGFREEMGEGPGLGFNRNFPQREHLDGEGYRDVLKQALKCVGAFSPSFLVVALGLDTSRKDPTGTWNLLARDFFLNGRLIGRMELPTLVVQEGGYNTRVLGRNARHFFKGLWEGTYRQPPSGLLKETRRGTDI